jgi:uncharacterized Zn ribbon protein
MTQPCPKCGSHNTYEIGHDYGCRMCAKEGVFMQEKIIELM